MSKSTKRSRQKCKVTNQYHNQLSENESGTKGCHDNDQRTDKGRMKTVRLYTQRDKTI